MKNHISIIIPTYERPGYLKKALEYWSIYPVDLIIVDGSSRLLIEKEIISLYINTQYYNLPISVEKRLMFATEKLKTPFAAIISDDEFLSYSALLEAANILNSEPDVSAVLGATIGFRLYQNRFVAQHHYESVQELNISAKTPKERLLQRLNVPGNSIYYPLVRTEVIQVAGKLMGEHQYTCPYVAEYLMEAVLCSAGAIKVMPRLMWFRSFEGNMVSTKDHNRDVLFYQWSADPKNSNEVDKLMASVPKYLSLKSSLSSINGLDFVTMFTKNERQSLNSKKNSPAIRRLYARLPLNYREFIRLWFYYIFRRTPEGLMPMSSIIKKLKTLNIDLDEDELSRISCLVEKNSFKL